MKVYRRYKNNIHINTYIRKDLGETKMSLQGNLDTIRNIEYEVILQILKVDVFIYITLT